MEFRQLRYFIAVAEDLHFGRAASRLHVAQPAISLQIKQLEDELGVSLLERNHRKVRLTEAGQVFLDRARLILDDTRRAAEITSLTGAGKAGQLSIGFVASAALHMLPEVLQEFRSQFPDVDLTLYQISTAEQLQALRDGRIAIGFVRGPDFADDLDADVLFSDPLLLALPAGHYLAELDHIDLLDLTSESFVGFQSPRDFSGHDEFIRICQLAGFTPRMSHHTFDILGALVLVAAHMGVAVVSAGSAQLQFPGVIYRPISNFEAKRPFAVAKRKGDSSPLVSAFSRVLAQWLKTKMSTPGGFEIWRDLPAPAAHTRN